MLWWCVCVGGGGSWNTMMPYFEHLFLLGLVSITRYSSGAI